MDTESEVAARVAQNIPKPTPEPTTPTTPVVDEPNQDRNAAIYLDDPVLNMKLSDHFQLSRTEKYTELSQLQLRTVINWAAEYGGSSDINDILLTVARAERELGFHMKSNKLGLLYRYVNIQKNTAQMQKELEWMQYE